MSARLETAAEIVKLARVLDLDSAELHYLRDVPAAELRAMRESVTDSLFDGGAHNLRRVAAGAKLLPSALVATIAQRAFGPLLCARAASAVDPAKAIDVARRLPADFLADVTVNLDPRRVAQIIANVPEALVSPVAAEMGARSEHVTMGRFLAFVPDHAVAAAMGVLDDEALIRSAFVLEHKDRLDHALGLLPPERLPGIIRCASALDLWAEALDLLEHLSDQRRGPIADVVAEQEPEVIARLVHAASEAELWDSLLPVVTTMSPSHRLRLAACPVFHDPAILEEILRAAAANVLWTDLLPLIDALPDSVRATAANLVARQGESAVASLVSAVSGAGLWAELLPLVNVMDEQSRVLLASMPVFHTQETLTELLAAASSTELWLDLAPLLDVLPTDALNRLAVITTELEPAALQKIASTAMYSADALLPLLRLVERLDENGRSSVVEIIAGIDHVDAGVAEALLVRFGPELDALPADIRAAVDEAIATRGLERR